MEHNRAELIARAEEASRLLNGAVCAEVFEAVYRIFVAEWEGTEDQQKQLKCWAKVAGLREVQRQLRRIVAQGEHASHQPDER